MKIIIDIPEEHYKNLAKIADAGKESLGYFERVIMLGIPLAEVKEEIKNMEYLACPQPEVVISDVLEIIDNIGKASGE